MTHRLRRRAVALTCALGLAIGAAACGGEDVVVTVTTDRLPGTGTTAPVTTAPPATTDAGPSTTAPPATTTETTGEGEVDLDALAELLPADGAVTGVTTGTVRKLPTADSLIDTLYQEGDPTAQPAKAELAGAGYRGGVLRDDIGTDPQNGLALFRSYIYAVADEQTAAEQATDAVGDVRGSGGIQSEDLEVPGVPGAAALVGTGEQGGTKLAIVFISFPVGDRVYGLQAIARDRSMIDIDQLTEVAQTIHAQGLRAG